MFLKVSFNFATAISKFDTFSSYHIVRTRIAKVTNFFRFCTIGISMYQKRILPYIIIPYFLTPSFFPFGAFQTDRRTDKFQHPLLPKFFFFPLSARGPTRRRNSTGLAELWGGWPIELVRTPPHPVQAPQIAARVGTRKRPKQNKTKQN
jgi:hypothetical protein